MKKVISRKNLPGKLPFHFTLTLFMALDYYNAPDWIRATLLTLLSVIWICCLVVKHEETQIDIFKGKK